MKHKTHNLTPIQVMIARKKMSKDIETYTHIGIVRSVVGVVCIGVGIGTWVVPMTTAPLIMLGSWLLGYDSKIIYGRIAFMSKNALYWAYANRNLKLIKRTLKRRLLLWD